MVWNSGLRAAIGVLLVAGIGAAAGCSSTNHAASPAASSPSVQASPSATGSAGGSTLAPAEAAKVLAAYRGTWMAFAKAEETADPDNAELRQYASGDALKQLVTNLVVNRQRGITSKGQPTLNPTIVSVGTPPITANVDDCGDSTSWLQFDASGKNTGPGGRRHITAVVSLAGDTWRMTSFTVNGLGTC